MASDQVTIVINGMRYGGWKSLSIERGITRAVSSFAMSVTERWANQDKPWKINPFDVCEVYIGADKLLTGYVETYTPSFDGGSHGVQIAGHSKTKDLTDCSLDIQSGQFSGFTYAAIAKAVCQNFNIGVVVQASGANEIVQNSNVNQGDTAFNFLERLARSAGILLCDDEQGNLVITTAASASKSSSALTQGQNILAAGARITGAGRFSEYIIKGQASVGYGASDTYGGAGGIPAAPAVGAVQTQMRASAVDTDVPRYRPRTTLAESQLTLEQMSARVNWQKQFAYGQATKASFKVNGFRQADGTLWRINQLVSCNAPWLSLDTDLLLATVKFSLGSDGAITELELGPLAGYVPEPAELKLHKAKRGKGSINWTGAGGVRGVDAIPSGGSSVA